MAQQISPPERHDRAASADPGISLIVEYADTADHEQAIVATLKFICWRCGPRAVATVCANCARC
jgi:hypothetical protein